MAQGFVAGAETVVDVAKEIGATTEQRGGKNDRQETLGSRARAAQTSLPMMYPITMPMIRATVSPR
jgi:hypothetical protein